MKPRLSTLLFMNAKDPLLHVFVDFENVPTVDLGLTGDRPIQITLLIGKNQKKLDLALVQQILRLAPRVRLVEVGASGHNALDLTLGYYLGQAVAESPQGKFFIVSKDKDFDPLIAHLQSNQTQVSRHDGFGDLPFLARAKKSGAAMPPAPDKTRSPEDRLERLIIRLRSGSAPRPAKKSSLLARISTDFGNKLSEAELHQKLAELLERGVVSLDTHAKVIYP